MAVPPKNHPLWPKVIHDQQNIQFEFFITKILLARLNSKVKLQPQSIGECVNELHEFFVKNESNPKALSDLNKIFNKGAF